MPVNGTRLYSVPYRPVEMICPDCGSVFTGSAAPRLQRCFKCSMTYLGEFLSLEHAIGGLSLDDVRQFRFLIEARKAHLTPRLNEVV